MAVKVQYRLTLLYGLGTPQYELLDLQPLISVHGDYLKVDYLNGKIVFCKGVTILMIEEIKT